MGELVQPAHLLVLVFVLIVCIGLFLLPMIFYILTLQRALEKCAPVSRTISPGSLWLLLVPFFNLIWHFLVVTGMAKSLGNEFRRRNAPMPDPAPGQSIGMAMCICCVCGIIPLLGIFAGLAYLVLWIMYWVKISEYSRILSESPAPITAAPLF